jgi:hypothetical protein
MIKIKILPIENFAAILAGVLVSFENVMPRKLHFLFREMIKYGEQNDAWNSNPKRDRID